MLEEKSIIVNVKKEMKKRKKFNILKRNDKINLIKINFDFKISISLLNAN